MTDPELFNLLLGCGIGYIIGLLVAVWSNDAWHQAKYMLQYYYRVNLKDKHNQITYYGFNF